MFRQFLNCYSQDTNVIKLSKKKKKKEESTVQFFPAYIFVHKFTISFATPAS